MSHKLLDETSAKAFRAAKLRYLFIVGAIVLISLICIGVFVYQNKQKKHLAKLSKEYAQIESLYYQENQQAQNTLSKSLQEQNQTVNHENSISKFRQFALEHAKDPYGWQAAIHVANYAINNDNIQATKELFEIIIPYTYNFPLLQIKFGTALAEIYINEKQYDKAIERLEYIDKIQNNPAREQTKLLYGQTLYLVGKTQEAKQVLESLNIPDAKTWLHYIES